MTNVNPSPAPGPNPNSGPHPAPGISPAPPHGAWRPVPPVPPAPPKPSARRRPWITYGVISLVALFFGVGIGASGSDETGSGSSGDAKAAPRPTVTVTEMAQAEAEPGPTVTETVTAKPKKTKKAGPASSFSGEGEYLVGEDIKAGTYKTAGPDGGFGCYWERAKDASGEFGSIIANNNLQGPGRVTINSGEYFKSSGCEKWVKVG
ncbi:hypothetical protein [Streptomyces sp. NPDC059786]|uniref:hypothetical protein n=1 Tax=Streptomyces sp. NPDC059786 TaxID=3346946 RepID=UPI003667942A